MKNFIIALITGFSAMVNSQNKLSGTITDDNNLPLSGVSVFVSGINKETISDESGKYTLTLPEGNLPVTFSCLGFIAVTKTVNISGDITLNIVMEENIHLIDEIIVSTPFNRLQSQNVMKVEHAGMKSLRQNGITTLVEGLAAIPGVSQVSTGISIGKPVIRGLSSNRVLVYSQGVRLENQQFGDEHGLGLNDSGIESVEVIKGPASLLYGSDALGGVLYFNPEKFAEAKTFRTDISQKYYSNTLGSNVSIGMKGSTENWKFLGRGSYSSHADYAIPSGKRVTNTRFDEMDFKSGIGYSNSKFSSVLRYNFNRLDLGIPEDGIAIQSESHEATYPKQAVDNHIVSLHNKLYFKGSTLDVDLGYIFNDRSEFEDSDIAILQMKLQTFNYALKYHLPKYGKFESIIGIQGMHQKNKNFGEEYLIPDAAINDVGIFGTTNYEWKSNALQAGLRYDNRKITTTEHGIIDEGGYFPMVNRSFDSFNASLGYKTNIQKETILRLNIASGFRAPNLAELTSNGVHEGTNRYEVGNPSLSNEQNLQTDINVEYTGSHFGFFVNGFYNHISDYIYAAPTGEVIDENDVYAYIQNDAYLYGGEAGIHLHPHPLDWLHIESSFETVTGKKSEGDYLPLVPANSWNNTIRTEFKIQKWLSEGFARVNVASTFAQKNVGGYEVASDGYTLVNASFGGKIKIGKTFFEVSFSGNNLFDQTYIAHLSRLKPDGIPNMGRNVVFGINFSL